VRRIIWTEAAENDLRGIREYYAQFNPIAANRLVRRLLTAAEELPDTPQMGRPIRSGRRELVSVWPYLIRYRVADDAIVILRIRHGRRRPQP
jgi:toxin ParE1/3/4